MEYIRNNIKAILWCGIIIIASVIIYFIFNRDNNGNVKDYYMPDFNKKYGVNEVIPVYITEENMANKYLSDYINLISYDIDKAYEYLDEESIADYPTLDLFKQHISDLQKKNKLSYNVKKYLYNFYEGKRSMTVVDDYGNTYIFIQKSIMDYTVVMS